MANKFKLLALDIETTPNKVYTWGLWNQNVGLNQIIEPGTLLCFSYQWQGSKTVKFMSEWDDGLDAMLKALWDLLDEADAILTYNGRSFDEKWIKGLLIEAGYTPPSPYAHIDLFRGVKANARMLSNKLDYVAGRLLAEHKTAHNGFSLWIGCMEGDKKSHALMKKYAIQDTKLLLPLFDVLRPWMKGLPNVALIEGKSFACPSCGSEDVQSRGTRFTQAGQYQQMYCKTCGAWPRAAARKRTTELRA